jgi:unsaturated rhamnogalacturonyl hydrolase
MKKTIAFSALIIFLGMSVMANSGAGYNLNHKKTSSKSEVNPNSQVSDVGKGKVVGLDNFYNNEWKKDKSGKSIPFHYLWEDQAESGFSELKGIINKLGAETATLRKAPTLADLGKFSIYFIVDPDTPLETEKPNYLEADAIKQIVDWVKNGGVLVLFGNDSINAEFEHWNQLAKNFGIQFEKNSVNKVTGTLWDMGKIDIFPNHPIFKNIRNIYLKEISTLKLQDPATPVLTRGNQVIMASAKLGKGFVFALGDPWIYNEYIGHMRLPENFQNFEAATNLFRWLLGMAKQVK